jgi:hypothetical protein
MTTTDSSHATVVACLLNTTLCAPSELSTGCQSSAVSPAHHSVQPDCHSSIPPDTPQFAAEVVTAFLPDADQLLAEDLTSLLTAVLAGMEQKKPHACVLLELLPACLAALQAAPGPASSTQATAEANAADAGGSQAAAAAAPGGGSVEAAKHRDAAVHRLCHCQWQPEQVCQVLSVLRGMALTIEQHKSLLAKAIRACRCVFLRAASATLGMFSQRYALSTASGQA